MRPRKTPTSTNVFVLPGGNEDNDLWVEKTEIDGQPVILSVWDLDDEERAAVAAGGTIELATWGIGHPPVSLAVGPSLEERKR